MNKRINIQISPMVTVFCNGSKYLLNPTCVILLILLLPVCILGSVWIYLFDAYLLRHNQRILDDYKNYIEEVKRIVHTYILKVLGVALGEQYAGCLHLKEQLLLVPT